MLPVIRWIDSSEESKKTKGCGCMNQEAIKKAGEIIASKANYVGGGMEGYAVLSLIDEKGYPSASALTIARADGINWLTFASGPKSNKAKRIAKCNKASVCIASLKYNITLVGTIEEVTDMEHKKASWCDAMNDGAHWNAYDDPNFYVMRFETERCSIFIIDGENMLEAYGDLLKQ